MKAGFALRMLILVLLILAGWGCGSTQQRDATEQLLTSDAVDRSVAQMDFRALSGETVYFDTTYLKNIKGVGFVNAEYITSALRQQLVAARCLLRDKKEEAEYVVEARIGVLGTDRHEITYGMPANNFLSAASSLVPNSPPLPTIPELAVAKRNEQLAAAKIAAFAYHQETGEPVWQSGVSPVRSTAKDTWVLGAGPFQRGRIYGGTQFAGTKLGFGFGHKEAEVVPLVDYNKPAFFPPRLAVEEDEKETEQTADAEGEKPDAETKTTAKSEPKPPEPKPEQVAEAPKAPKAPEPAPSAEETPPAVAESPAGSVRNPLAKAIELDSGLRLRFHFEEPAPIPTEDLGLGDEADSGLFRLDPIEE